MRSRFARQLALIQGVPLFVHASWLPLALVGGAWLALGWLPARWPTLAAPAHAALALLMVLLFFLSVLAHEWLHLWVARRRAVALEWTLLFPFGGMAQSSRRPLPPRESLLLALAGPAASLLLALLFGVLALYGGGTAPLWAALAGANALLALLNLLPIHPLDGGRIVEALLWKATGDLGRALQVTRAGGWFAAFVLVVEGVLLLLWFGNVALGLLCLLLGWAVQWGTDVVPRDSRVGLLLRGLSATRAMRPLPSEPLSPRPPSIDGAASLLEALEQMEASNVAQLLVSEEGVVVGLLTRGSIVAQVGAQLGDGEALPPLFPAHRWV